MKKSVLVIITMFLILIEISSLFLMYKSSNNRKLFLEDKIVEIKDEIPEGIAIMIQKDDKSGYYESTSSKWPSSVKYSLNGKSGCVDRNGKDVESEIGFKNNIITLQIQDTSFCYLYFDIIAQPITLLVNTDGVDDKLPTDKGYENEVFCDAGNGIFNEKYQRFEFLAVELGTPYPTCDLHFDKISRDRTTLISEVENNGTSFDGNSGEFAGIRFIGKNPSNYVWFNNEMWRIIGIIPACEDINNDGTCKKTENLVKILREDSIGKLPFDTSGSYIMSNDGELTNTGFKYEWGENTLYKLLNNYYYGRKNASIAPEDAPEETGCILNYQYISPFEKIDLLYGNCDWRYSGISDVETNQYTKMIKNVYWNTGETTVDAAFGYNNGMYPSSETVSKVLENVPKMFTEETKSHSKLSYIGLMNKSDILFANSTYMISSGIHGLTSFVENNWIYKYSDEMFINKNSISWSGINDVNIIRNVRPSLYLDPAVYVISGDGSINNPYIIGI